MLGQRRRRGANIKSTLVQRFVFAGPGLDTINADGLQQGAGLGSIPKFDQALGCGGPRVVVSTAAFHARVRGSVPGLGGFKETNNVSSPSTRESQYCGEPP